MRFVHTADLHLGRRLSQMSLEEDLEHILEELADLVVRSRAQALVVAGDVFDSPNPQESAMRQWDRFITRMAESGVPVLAVGGNHDSGARLAVGSELIARSGIHIAGELEDEIMCVEVEGVNFWLIPFVRPVDVSEWAAEQGIAWEATRRYNDALRLICDHIKKQPAFAKRPNVAVAHQYVVAGSAVPERSDSEQMLLGSSGELEAVDCSCFEGFAYVALGHLHAPQRIGRDTCRYAGSPLKLSASEMHQRKSFTVVGIKESDEGIRIKMKLVEVEPMRDFRVERGSVAELVARAEAEDEHRRQDFVHAIVTDDELDVAARLRHAWPNIEQVTFDNESTRSAAQATLEADVEVTKDVDDLFREFFERETGKPLSPEQEHMVADALERAARKGDE